MSARVNILYNVIKSRVPVMSLQCRRLLDSSILPSLPDFEGAMDCSLREAGNGLLLARSLAQRAVHCPKKSIFWTHQDQVKAKNPYIRVLLVFQKRLDFLQAKEWFF